MKNKTFANLLKKHTTIDKEFIETFFNKFKIGEELNFDIKDIDVSNYLDIKLSTLRKRLNNGYSIKKLYYDKLDYIKRDNVDERGITYWINYPCFERLAMNGDSEQAEIVRLYFVKLREFLTDNQHVIYQSMENYENLKKYVDKELIYFFVADDRHPDILKIGHTKSIINRLRVYNTGKVHDVELKYVAVVKNSKIIEKCVKLNTIENQVIHNREILRITPTQLKKIIDKCYCKYVTRKQNDSMYEELSQLSGLYEYVKNKVHHKPYVIIGNDI